MQSYGAKELASSFRLVRKNTITIAEEIDEKNYGFSATPDTRTVAKMLTHIALASRFPQQIHGVDHLTTLGGYDFPTFFNKLMAQEQEPRTKDQIVTLLREEGEKMGTWLESLSDDFLAERVSFPAGMTPPDKSRLEMLLSVKEHEMHHRGQLMLMERMVGIVPHLTREMQARMASMMATKASA